MKIVINQCFGGFGISKLAAEYMASKGHAQAQEELSKDKFYGNGYTEKFPDGYDRSDPLLVEAVEKLGKDASDELANLVVVEIPDGIEWQIEEYDGMEHVAEKHRTWS